MPAKSYLQIEQLIKNRIESGELQPNDILPSEKKLCEQTNIGRSTVRKGLSKLVADGYIYSVQGKGYYVCAPKHGEFALTFNETKAIETSAEQINIIGVDIIDPPKKIAEELRLAPNKKVVILKRMILNKNARIALDCKYMPYSAKSPIVEKELYNATFPEMFAKEKSLFDIQKKIKIRVGTADRETAKTLRAQENEPIIIIEQNLYDENEFPIGYGVTKFLGKHFKIKAATK